MFSMHACFFLTCFNSLCCPSWINTVTSEGPCGPLFIFYDRDGVLKFDLKGVRNGEMKEGGMQKEEGFKWSM